MSHLSATRIPTSPIELELLLSPHIKAKTPFKDAVIRIPLSLHETVGRVIDHIAQEYLRVFKRKVLHIRIGATELADVNHEGCLEMVPCFFGRKMRDVTKEIYPTKPKLPKSKGPLAHFYSRNPSLLSISHMESPRHPTCLATLTVTLSSPITSIYIQPLAHSHIEIPIDSSQTVKSIVDLIKENSLSYFGKSVFRIINNGWIIANKIDASSELVLDPSYEDEIFSDVILKIAIAKEKSIPIEHRPNPPEYSNYLAHATIIVIF